MNYEAEGEARPKSRGVPPPVVCSDLSSSSSSDARVAAAERQQRASGMGGGAGGGGALNGCPATRIAQQSQTHCIHLHHQSAQHLPSSAAAAAAAAASSSPVAPRRRRQRARHAHTHGALLLRPGCSSTSHRVRLHAHHTHYASCRGVGSAVCCAEACCREGALGSAVPSPGGGGCGALPGNMGGRVVEGGGVVGGGGGGGVGVCATSAASSTCGETPRSALLQQRGRRHRHRPASRSTHRARSVGVPCSRVRTSRFCVQLAPCAAAAAAVAAAASAKYGAHRSRREPKSRGRLVCSRCCGSLCPEEMMYCPLLCTASSESGTTTPRTPRLAFTSRRRVARHLGAAAATHSAAPTPAPPPPAPPPPLQTAATTPPSHPAATAAAAYCCGTLRPRRHRPGAVAKPSYSSAVTLPTTQYSRRTVLASRTCDPAAAAVAAAAEISAVTTDVDALLAEYERAYAARTRGFLNAGAPSLTPLAPPPSSPPPLSPPPQPPPAPTQPSQPAPQHHQQQQPMMPLWMTRPPPTSLSSLAPQQQRSTSSQPQQQVPLLSAPQQSMLLPTPGLRAAMGEPYPPPQRPQGSDVILSGLLSELVSQGYSVNINATEGPLDRGPPQPPLQPLPPPIVQQPQSSLPPQPQPPPQAQMQPMQPPVHHTMPPLLQQSMKTPLQQSMPQSLQQSIPQPVPPTTPMMPPPPLGFRQSSPGAPALSGTGPSAVSTPAFDTEGNRGAPLSPSLARLMAPRRDAMPSKTFAPPAPPSATRGRPEEVSKTSPWEDRSSKEAVAAAATHRHKGDKGERDSPPPPPPPQTMQLLQQQLGSEDERAFTPLTLASASPSLSLSSRGTAVESALQASATLMDLCASGARVLAPRKQARTKETRSAPVPGCGCRGAESGDDRGGGVGRGSGGGEARYRGRARSREDAPRQETPLRCLFERAKNHGDRMSSSVSTQRRHSHRHRGSAAPHSQDEYEERIFDDEDPWLVGSLADPSLDTCSTTSSRCSARDDSMVKGVYAVNMRSAADVSGSPATAAAPARAIPAPAAGNLDSDQRTREQEGESSADVELRASKSYIVQLIDRALSREMGEGGCGGTSGGGGPSGGGGTGGGDGGGSGGGTGGGGGDGFKGGIESKTIRHRTQSGSLKTLYHEKEDMITHGDPVTVSTSVEPSAVDYGSIDRNTTFSSPSPQPSQQHNQQQHHEQQRQQCHQQETQKHILQQQQQLLMEELQRSTHALQQPIYPPMMQLLQPSSEGLGKTNYLLVPLPGNSSTLWSPTRIAEEPPYMRQLRQLRWDHLKHIQREIQRLEEIERVQNGWPTGEKPSTS